MLFPSEGGRLIVVEELYLYLAQKLIWEKNKGAEQ